MRFKLTRKALGITGVAARFGKVSKHLQHTPQISPAVTQLIVPWGSRRWYRRFVWNF